MLYLNLGFINQRVHRFMKTDFGNFLVVGNHIERAIGFISETVGGFGKVAKFQVSASFGLNQFGHNFT